MRRAAAELAHDEALRRVRHGQVEERHRAARAGRLVQPRPARRRRRNWSRPRFTCEDAVALAKTATLLGRDAEATVHEELAESVRKAFDEKFFDTKTHRYGTGFRSTMLRRR